MKLFLPVSHNGGGDGKTGWAVSLATSFNGRSVHFKEMGGSHADRQCNNMANELLRTDCDIIGIIDIDTIFRQCDADRAIAHLERGIPAVWGLYPKKQDEAPPCINTWPEPERLVPDEFGLVNVRRAGRGFLFIARGVFEALKEENGGPARKFLNHGDPEWAFFHSGVVDGEYSALGGGAPEWISEDWMFCEDIRKHLGIQTLVDTRIALAHVGEKVYQFPSDRLARMDSNISSWRDIHGWFDFEECYRRMVSEIPEGGSIVEVGCWLGKSVAALHAFAQEAGKNIRISVVDNFDGNPDSNEQALILEAHGGNVEKAFVANMRALGITEMSICNEGSPKAARYHEDDSLDAVFIDAAHDQQSVENDIGAWLPKVKPGGILAGHDYDEAGVKSAVDSYFDSVETIGRCWWVKVKD